MAPEADGALSSDELAARRHDADLVAAALAGDDTAFGRLFDRWYDRVVALAERIVRDHEIAREVAQDTFLSAWRNLPGLEDHLAFGGWLLRAARNKALNRSAREARSRPVDDEVLGVIEQTGASPWSAPPGFGVEDRVRALRDPGDVAADAEIVALVREVVAALGERDAEVLDLQLRYGLSPAEVGEVLGLNRNAANQLVHRVKGRFAAAFGARTLWRDGRPACPELARALERAGSTGFGPEAVKVAERHVTTCASCEERRHLHLQPAALFGALPLLAVPAVWKAEAAAALSEAGVPMSGSTYAAGATAPRPDVSGSDSSGETGPGDPTGAGGREAPSVRRRRVVLAAAAVVLVLAVLAVVDRELDDGTAPAQVAASGTTVTAPTTATTVTAPTDPSSTAPSLAVVPDPPAAEAPPATTDPGVVSPSTTSPPVTTVPVPAAPVVSLTTSRTTLAGPFRYPTAAPVLTWSATDADQVTVTGIQNGSTGVIGTGTQGSTPVCPGTLSASTPGGPLTCTPTPGTHRFVAEAVGPGGVTRSEVTITA